MLNQYRYQSGQFLVELDCLRLSGEDLFYFLAAQSTYDIKDLSSGEFHLAAFLDPQGRTECYGWLLRSENEFFYLVPPKISKSAYERLNRYLISENVTIDPPEREKWCFVLGPKAQAPERAFKGILFDETAYLFNGRPVDAPLIPAEDVEIWRGLTGWPCFDGKGIEKEVINNQRLYDLAVSSNKGCYPGQETVSKIATRRGAAYAPVLLEVEQALPKGEMSNFGKKIGVVGASYAWEGKYFIEATLLRDFRVEKMKVSFELNGFSESALVRYYPLLSGSSHAKAEELFFLALEFFKKDNYEAAEGALRQAIDLDPIFADAYESLGVMLGRLERFDEAIDLMRKLSEVDPGSVLAHTNMSLYLMRLGKIEEAEAEKAQATLKSFKHFGTEAKLREEAEKQKKAQDEDWVRRESMFLQVLAIDEEDTLANYGIGSIAVEKGEWERARGHLEKVIKSDPKYSVAYLALGKAYFSLGDKSKAKEVWQKGVRVAAGKGDLMPANLMHSELERL